MKHNAKVMDESDSIGCSSKLRDSPVLQEWSTHDCYTEYTYGDEEVNDKFHDTSNDEAVSGNQTYHNDDSDSYTEL